MHASEMAEGDAELDEELEVVRSKASLAAAEAEVEEAARKAKVPDWREEQRKRR